MGRDGLPAVLGEQCGDLGSLQLAVLEHEGAAGVQQPQRRRGDLAHHIQAVLATVEGNRGVEQPHLRIARNGIHRNVRRIRDDDGHGAVEVG